MDGMSRRLVPVRESVVCRKISTQGNVKEDNLVLLKERNVDLYEVLEISPDSKVNFKCGDVVMSNSTGDEIEINEGETVYLFKTEHIMCRVED